ncbi:MAG: heme-binding domain-containing protein [Cyclobacteriaceae bacterium]|nr:heme-binding domain-containing protein [Cyclobacteriaceae bacterium]
MKKKIGYALVAVLVLIQFIRPDRNLSDDRTLDFSQKYPVSEEVKAVMAVACNDCHTNLTRYPWYANVQPFGWILTKHVNDGKRHLNLSTFLRLPVAVQNHKLEEIIEQVKEKEMPLPSYTWLGLHADANLTDEQRVLITTWAQAQMDTLRAQYPPDSLVMKRRGPPPSGM